MYDGFELNVNRILQLGGVHFGIFNLYGGTVHVGSCARLGASDTNGSGVLNLLGGQMNTQSLEMYNDSRVWIRGGQMYVEGNCKTAVEGFISAGKIRGAEEGYDPFVYYDSEREQTVLGAAGKLCYWNFDENQTVDADGNPENTVVHDSAGTADGLAGSGVSFISGSSSLLDIGLSKAADFSGAGSDCISLESPGELDLGTADFTVTGWFKCPSISGQDNYHLLFQNGKHDAGGVNLWIAGDSRSYRGRFGFDIKGPAANITVLSAGRYDDDQWHWFAACADAQLASLYIDGVFQGSAAYQAGTTATAPDGYEACLGVGWYGQIDDVRVYSSFIPGDVLANLVTNTAYCNAPIIWIPPEGFDAQSDTLGMDVLTNVQNVVLFDPEPTDACDTGVYESSECGMFNHDAYMIFADDQENIVIYWNNHAVDENAPGGRVLAIGGVFEDGGASINWGEPCELVPPPVDVARRPETHDAEVITEHCGKGLLYRINEKLYLWGTVSARAGWSDTYSSIQSGPVPYPHFSNSKTTLYRNDVGWDIGPDFWQQWDIVSNNCLSKATVKYISEPQLTEVQVSEDPFAQPIKTVQPSGGSYAIPPAAFYAGAPVEFRDDVQTGARERDYRVPNASGRTRFAADGYDGLSHRSEFQRPDGKWVVIRDNLSNRGRYYASLKDSEADDYPLAHETSLYGYAWGWAGSLPDGRCYIIGNSDDRSEMFLTVSADGITFDKTWLLLHKSIEVVPGLGKPERGGPQYFKSIVKENVLWICYSIGKEQIGLTRVAIDDLH